MPSYPFACDECKIQTIVKMTFEQHENTKDHIYCDVCDNKMYQLVSPLNFRLQGDCWNARGAGFNSQGVGYEMTDNSMKKSREEVAKLEDVANNFTEKQ
jgi:predicted nucleic acid-binding Zn ribbon protein